MVAFDKPKVRFNYRVAGVAIHNGRVLLDRNTRNDYWVLPGGHPDMMESMVAALQREMYEEIGVHVSVVRLLWVVENFFVKKKPVHELSFFFLIALDPTSNMLQSDGPFYGEEYENQLIYQWHPIEEDGLLQLPLYPRFLASSLNNLPASPQHIVFDDTSSPSTAKPDALISTIKPGKQPPLQIAETPGSVPVKKEKKWNKA